MTDGGDDAFRLRDLEPGDLGRVVHRHGVLYAREYGWDERFEALVAKSAAACVIGRDPRRERWWIAERSGRFSGCVCVASKSAAEARLHFLLVEPEARGAGLGTRLVAECIAFARAAGYVRIALWTNSILVGARRIYARAGFRIAHSEPHRRFGEGLVGETWELRL